MQEKKSAPCGLGDLPPELLTSIAERLPANEAACAMRPLAKRTAMALRKFTTIRLSQPSPPAIFAVRWGAPGAVCNLNISQQRKVFMLTAQSGSAANMRLLVQTNDEFWVDRDDVFSAAIKAHQLPMCQELVQLGWNATNLDGLLCEAIRAGCDLAFCQGLFKLSRAEGGYQKELDEAWDHAASLGRPEICRWLEQLQSEGLIRVLMNMRGACASGLGELVDSALQRGPDGTVGKTDAWDSYALGTAAAGGHVDLLARLLETARTQELKVKMADVAVGAAYGLSLAELQRYVREAVSQGGGVDECFRGNVMRAAASSPTPDWKDKVSWLLQQGYPAELIWLIRYTLPQPMPRPKDVGMLERFEWLQGQGIKLGLALLTFTLTDNFPLEDVYELAQFFARTTPDGEDKELAAACMRGGTAEGHVWEALRALIDSGRLSPSCAAAVARPRSTFGVDWWPSDRITALLVRHAAQDPALRTEDLFAKASESADLALLKELRALGCEWSGQAWELAEEYGCEEVIRWLRDAGCPKRRVYA